MTRTVFLALVLSLSLSSLAFARGNADLRANRARLAETAESISEYRTMNGGYPLTLDEMEPALYRVRPDLDGRPPIYKLAEDAGSFELSFVGPDGVEGTSDDIRYESSPRRARRPFASFAGTSSSY